MPSVPAPRDPGRCPRSIGRRGSGSAPGRVL